MVETLYNSVPADISQIGQQSGQLVDSTIGETPDPALDDKISKYVVSWKQNLRRYRSNKMSLWTECWQMYRGKEDWGDKDDWQSKIFIPKSFASVKQATNNIKRLLTSSPKPWFMEGENPNDIVSVLRATRMEKLTQHFLNLADWMGAFEEGLESGFIMGLGVWKLWWGLESKVKITTQPTRLPTGQMSLQTVRQEIEEGRLFIKAVDPFNFFWLPGSKLNNWVGTIEETEISKWELQDLAEKGAFGPDGIEKVAQVKASQIDAYQKQASLRFDEYSRTENPAHDTAIVKLTEFFGPIIIDGKLVERHGHVILANDKVPLVNGKNNLWSRKPPYGAFSPLILPFRTEGVGIVEMVRAINQGLNKIANLSVDTLLFKLLPILDATIDVYENKEDFETGLTPGKVFRRNIGSSGIEGIRQIPFEDVSPGAMAVGAQLDRAHQEGSLISEIQQAIPKWAGYTPATETEIKQQNQDSFFGSMAKDIEDKAVKNIVKIAMDLILQFLDTASNERVAGILGVDAYMLMGMSKPEIVELIQGEHTIKVSGITEQLEKSEMLNNLVQFMNIVGQNSEAWAPYINSNELLKRILEAFRPVIRDIDNIVVDQETAQAKMEMAYNKNVITPQIMQMLPQMAQIIAGNNQAERQAEKKNEASD